MVLKIATIALSENRNFNEILKFANLNQINFKRQYIMREKIRELYCKPFLEELANEASDPKKEIADIFYAYQYALGAINHNNRSTNDHINPLTVLNLMLKDCSDKFKKLTAIYFKDESIVNFKLEDDEITAYNSYTSVEVRTAINEFFHEFINPLPFMKMPALPYLKIKNNIVSESENIGIFSAIPDELQFNIFSFLDYKSLSLLQKTCKAFLFNSMIHKLQHGKQYYTVGKPIKITRPARWYDLDTYNYVFRKDITDEELIESFKLDQTKLFTSLYHAIEYALQGIVKVQHDDVLVPSIGIVYLEGNSQNLEFITENISVNKNSWGTYYQSNHRDLQISYALTKNQSLFLKVGTVLLPDQYFANYLTFKNVVFIESEVNLPNETSRSECICM